MPSIEDPSASPDVSRPGRPASGLEFYVAQKLEEVEEAWELVYDAYRRDDLIDVNPHRVHTTTQAVGPNTAVILGCLGPLAVGTISAYTDGPDGLPLDSVYLTEISALRKSGRRLMEVGLFADRREHINRAADGLFALMRFAYFFGFPMECDDVVIGVHPRHAPFYMRLLGFERIGPVRSYPTVKDHAVVLLRLRLKESLQAVPLPKGLAYFSEMSVSGKAFEQRFRFDKAQLADSRIGRFLAERKSVPASVA
jgi:hypothetical protein